MEIENLCVFFIFHPLKIPLSFIKYCTMDFHQVKAALIYLLTNSVWRTHLEFKLGLMLEYFLLKILLELVLKRCKRPDCGVSSETLGISDFLTMRECIFLFFLFWLCLRKNFFHLFKKKNNPNEKENQWYDSKTKDEFQQLKIIINQKSSQRWLKSLKHIQTNHLFSSLLWEIRTNEKIGDAIRKKHDTQQKIWKKKDEIKTVSVENWTSYTPPRSLYAKNQIQQRKIINQTSL